MASIFFLILYCLACACLGVRLLTMLGWKNHKTKISSAALLALSLLLGSGVLAGLLLILALVGLFSYLVILLIVIAAIISGIFILYRFILPSIRQLRHVLLDWLKEPILWKLTEALTTSLVGLNGLSWFFENRLTGDANAFYLVIAKATAASERLLPLPGYETYSNIPLLGEIHYAALMKLGAGKVCVFFVYVTAMCMAVLLLAMARRSGMGRRGQWITLALLFCSTAFTFIIGDGKVDLFGAAFALAAVYWVALLTPEDASYSAGLVILGLLSGFAIAAKFSYLLVLAPMIAILLVWNQWQYHKPVNFQTFIRKNISSWIQVVFFVFAALLPNLVKNTVLFQEPFAPIITKSESWLEQDWFTASTTTRLILTYPFALIYGNYFGQYGNLSPLAVAFAPLIFINFHKHSFFHSLLFRLSVAALTGFLVWVVLRTSTFAPRYFLSPLLILMLISAFGAEKASVFGIKFLRILVPLSIIFAVYISFDTYTKQYAGFFEYVKGNITREMYLSPSFEAYDFLNANTSDGDRILAFDYYTYPLRPDLILCMDTLDDKIFYQVTPEEKWEHIYNRGFRYTYVFMPTHARQMEPLLIPEGIPDWLEVNLVYNHGNHQIYEIRSKDPSRVPEIACKRYGSPTYQLTSSGE